MVENNLFFRDLASALPDIPRWVETRSMLLSGRCQVFWNRNTDPGSFVVCNPEFELISVVGIPKRRFIEAALEAIDHDGVILACPENAGYVSGIVPEWSAGPAVLHMLDRTAILPAIKDKLVRFIEPHEIEADENLPSDLKEEFIIVSRISPIAASIVGGRPVSFCYAGSHTETLWDISIDTLDGYRNRGHAIACVIHMIEYMRGQGKEPIWGAEESNRASMNLAAKLGFVEVDRITVIQPMEP